MPNTVDNMHINKQFGMLERKLRNKIYVYSPLFFEDVNFSFFCSLWDPNDSSFCLSVQIMVYPGILVNRKISSWQKISKRYITHCQYWTIFLILLLVFLFRKYIQAFSSKLFFHEKNI